MLHGRPSSVVAPKGKYGKKGAEAFELNALGAAQGLVAGAADRGRSAVQCVLCLGHNKGMEEAASDLAVCHLGVWCRFLPLAVTPEN